jgi:D-3-phosphoglycerate dehydrogenase / 2-oxoglutarate reductase
MSRPLVVVTDAPFPSFESAKAVLRELDAHVRVLPESTPGAIASGAAHADAVMVTYAKMSTETINQLAGSRIIARMGIGLDNIDVQAATASGIVVTNVPDYCVDEVSDHALALLLALARRVPKANRLVQAGVWAVKDVGSLHRLRGQVLGLAGFGRIGRALSYKAQALGMQVITHDPYLPTGVAEEAGVERVELDQLLRRSDAISVHTPLTKETRHLFGPATFTRMKYGAVFINTSRGGLVDEVALVDALERGDLSGAGLDVVDSEPLSSDSPLRGRDDVILTPHIAYYSEESTAELQKKAAEDVVSVLRGETPRYPVNPDILTSPSRRHGSIHRDFATAED